MVVGIVLVIFENFKNEIIFFVGWYERVNIVENMLDVLMRSFGEFEDWEKNIVLVIVFGLRLFRGNNLDYLKVMVFVEGVKVGNFFFQSVLWDFFNG